MRRPEIRRLEIAPDSPARRPPRRIRRQARLVTWSAAPALAEEFAVTICNSHDPRTDYRLGCVSPSVMSARMDRPAFQPARFSASTELVKLLHAVAMADRRSFAGLYDRTSAKLYGICLRVLRNEADAQDVLQEVYVTVWRKAAHFHPPKPRPIPWPSVLV